MLMGRSHVMLLLYIGCLAAHLQSCSSSCSRAAPRPPPPHPPPSKTIHRQLQYRRQTTHVSARAFKCSLR